MIPVLDVDPQQRLPREAELRELEVVQVPAADGGHVGAVVPVLGEGRAHIQNIVAVPWVILKIVKIITICKNIWSSKNILIVNTSMIMISTLTKNILHSLTYIPASYLLRPDEAEGGGGLGVGGDGGEQLLGVGRDVGEGVSVARALAHAAAQQQPVRPRVQHQHLQPSVALLTC